MAWEITEEDGSRKLVGGNELRKMAIQGQISRETPIRSTKSGKTVLAGEIAGLVWPNDLVDELDDAIQMVPPQLPPTMAQPSKPVGSRQQMKDSTDDFSLRYLLKWFDAFLDYRFNSFLLPLIISMSWIGWLLIFTIMIPIITYIAFSKEAVYLEKLLVWLGMLSVLSVLMICVRITLECFVVFFRMANDLRIIARNSTQDDPA